MKAVDILFTGHLCMDEIYPFQSEKIKAPGSAVLCGSVAAARTGKNIAGKTYVESFSNKSSIERTGRGANSIF